MKGKGRRTLTGQLIGRQTLLLAILLLVVGVSQYLILRHVLFASTAKTLHDEITVLTPIIHHTLSQRGIAGLSHIASLLVTRLKSPGVEVVITNALGHVVASSSTLHAKVPPLATGHYSIWNHRIVVDAVIGNTYYPSGYVWLLSSDHSIHDILRRDAELFSLLAILCLVIAGWLGSVSVRQTLNPLHTMRRSTQRIASGDFGHLTAIDNAPAELRDLGESIDRMSESIQTLFAEEKQLSEHMRRFVADASHELRTPLTGITGFLDLMARGELTPEEQQRGLQAIQAQGQRMGRLVNQLLTLSRMDSAPQAQIAPVPLSLDRWIEDLAPQIESLVNPRPLTLHTDPVQAMADPDRLTEVLMNLVDNVKQYTPSETRVTIRVGRQEDHAVIQCEDTGPGIPPEDLPHVFERFYRGDRARTSKSGGSGLGLSIVRSIIEAQGGDIRVEGAIPHGTRFVVTLPQA